jgi:hypothetical protein
MNRIIEWGNGESACGKILTKKFAWKKIRKSDPKSRKSEVFPSENPIIRHPRFLKIRSENPIRTLENPKIRISESGILINPIRKSDPRFIVHPLQPCLAVAFQQEVNKEAILLCFSVFSHCFPFGGFFGVLYLVR